MKGWKDRQNGESERYFDGYRDTDHMNKSDMCMERCTQTHIHRAQTQTRRPGTDNVWTQRHALIKPYTCVILRGIGSQKYRVKIENNQIQVC